jgi:hypothetical protein
MTSEGTHDVQKCRENLKPKEAEPPAPPVTSSEQDKTLGRVRFLLVMFVSRGRSDEFENHESKS